MSRALSDLVSIPPARWPRRAWLRHLIAELSDIALQRCLVPLERDLAALAAAERRVAAGASERSVSRLLEAKIPWWAVERRCGECGRRNPDVAVRRRRAKRRGV